jgi:hypothetical protein
MNTEPANYAMAYFAWLRRGARMDGGEPGPPNPAAYGLEHGLAAVIARQCEIEFSRTANNQKPE